MRPRDIYPVLTTMYLSGHVFHGSQTNRVLNIQDMDRLTPTHLESNFFATRYFEVALAQAVILGFKWSWVKASTDTKCGFRITLPEGGEEYSFCNGSVYMMDPMSFIERDLYTLQAIMPIRDIGMMRVSAQDILPLLECEGVL